MEEFKLGVVLKRRYTTFALWRVMFLAPGRVVELVNTEGRPGRRVRSVSRTGWVIDEEWPNG